ncbi:MAG: dihydroorotase [Ruminococcaceae bacterium]|nr:dihydroorotase [Oscillospiraceae bacterium]
MKVFLKNAKMFQDGRFVTSDFSVIDGVLSSVDTADKANYPNFSVYENCYIFPGFCDVHVHFREPGFSYKETVKSGSMAAARGGYTSVCTMPNLNPVPDSKENLDIQLDIIKKDAVINVHPYGAITVGEKGEKLSDMEAMADEVVGFSDDGRGVQSEALMLEAMIKAKELGKPIVAHCEDNSLLRGGYIHDGEYAARNSHAGICSESEWGPIARDIELIKRSGCAYHVCHISTKESVDIIRRAKAEGVDITCETGPHYLTMNDMQLKDEGRFKMNPPIRSEEDRRALVEGLIDGTIDMVATDHAPHSAEEKSKGLKGSLMGVVGIETAFPILYTELVKTGIITLEKLVEVLSINARKRFGLKEDVGYTVWKLDEKYVVDPEDFLSMGRSTPFEGKEVYGKNIMTLLSGKIAYENI